MALQMLQKRARGWPSLNPSLAIIQVLADHMGTTNICIWARLTALPLGPFERKRQRNTGLTG